MRISSVALCLFLSTSASAQVFNLADASRGGDGVLPGSVGYSRYWPPNNQRMFLPQPSFQFVDGVFVPFDKQTTQITSTKINFDFSQWIGGTSAAGAVTDGTPAFGPGANNDPSNKNGNPDYTGDTFNHSLMMTHANVGITFDLAEVRKVFPGGAYWFTALAGASCGQTSYFVVTTDFVGTTKLVARGGGMTASKQPDKIKIQLLPTIRFLTLVGGDDNRGTINCAHAFFGDPFLHCGDPDNGSVRRFGFGGMDSTMWQARALMKGCPTIGTTLEVGGSVGTGVQIGPLLFAGFSDKTWGAVPLPFDLKLLGAPGNTLYTGIDFGLLLVPNVAPLPSVQDNRGRVWGPYPRGGKGGRISLPLPANTALRGQSVFWQSLVLDPKANAFGIVLSDAIRTTLQ